MSGCPKCAPRYCAPARCYCAHEECPAFESWVDIRAIPFRDAEPKKNPARSSWDNREGETWIDSM